MRTHCLRCMAASKPRTFRSGNACSPSPGRPTWSASATWTPAIGPRIWKAARGSATSCCGCWCVSNAMAILLQTLRRALGIVTGRDLAQACRENYPRPGQSRAVGSVRNSHRCVRFGRSAGSGHRAEPAVPHSSACWACCSPPSIRCWFSGYSASASAIIEAFVLGLIAIIAVCFAVEFSWAKPALGHAGERA